MTLSRSLIERLTQEDESFAVDEELLEHGPRELGEDESADPDYRPGAGRPDEDMAVFRQLNERTGQPRTKADHVDRMNAIAQQIPSVRWGKEEWTRIFRDRPEIFRALCRELAYVDAAQDLRPGVAGRRPKLSAADGARRLLRMFGKEYSLLPFSEAFVVLCGQRSMRSVVAKTGLSRGRVFRLQHSQIQPTAFDMEQVAKAFAVHPSYFIEWRTAFVIGAIADRMAGSPETSMNLYQKMMHA